jgi:hypothetical protein
VSIVLAPLSKDSSFFISYSSNLNPKISKFSDSLLTLIVLGITTIPFEFKKFKATLETETLCFFAISIKTGSLKRSNFSPN